MDPVSAKLEIARQIVIAAMNTAATSTSGTPQGTGQGLNSAAGTETASHTDTETATTPNLGSSGVDHVNNEHTIAEGGSETDDEGIDRVSIYEYDLGSYGDSVSSVDLSAVPGDAQLNLVGWDASGNAIVSIGDDGVIITVEASASAYLAELTYGAAVGPLSLNVEALVGARADASASFNINPMEGDFEVELEGGVVVGATVNANGELDLKYVAVEAGATGVAGFAAEGHLDVGFDDWEFEFDAGGKLAFLLGGGADISFSVDGQQVVMDSIHMGKVVWDTGGNVIGVGADALESISDFTGDTLNVVDDIIPGEGVPFIPGI